MTSSSEKDFALEVVRRLRGAGFEALWAGGCVRDLLMQREPTDYDVATSATPQQVRELFGRRRTLAVGMAFGVIVVLNGEQLGSQVEVATFRTDAAYSDGRRPDAVTFSDARHDAQRRDFTINGMFYDPLQKALVDYVDGQSDLQQGLIRAIGCASDRIAEDKLRMLRAIRFAARFGFAIEPETRAAIARHSSEVTVVSGERIWMEIGKTLETERPAWAVVEWAELGLLEHILPEVSQQWVFQGRDIARLLEASQAYDWLTRFCGLVGQAVGHDSSRVESTVRSLKNRLKFSNEVGDTLGFSLMVQATLAYAEKKPWSVVQPSLVDKNSTKAVELFEMRSQVVPAEQVAAMSATARWLRQQLQREPSQVNPPQLLVGDDLIAQGLTPGPQFRALLQQARQLQLDQILVDRPAALQWLRDKISQSS